MIDEIHIRDVALIREASFAPATGLTVVTGETGAGKTALLHSLKLLVGERADATLVRQGAEELQVEGRFLLTDEEGAESEAVAARRVNAQGRSRASIDGSLASLKELSARFGESVDLCGQHEHQQLLSPVYQRNLLDAWGAASIAQPHAAYRAALQEVADAQAELDRLQNLAQTEEVALDRARFAIDQINAVDPQPTEYEDLLAAMPRLEHGEQLISDMNTAHQALAGDGAAIEHIEAALAALDRVAAIDANLADDVQAVRDAYFSLEEVARSCATYRDSIDFSQEELESAQDRVAELQGLMRGFGPRMEDVFALRDESEAKLAEYESRDELICAAEATLEEAQGRLTVAATQLQSARESVVPQFLDQVHAQLQKLEMGSAHLEGAFEELPREKWNSWGSHSFELTFAAGADLKPQRLNRIASGGELSRVMLALKVVLGASDAVDTLVFDEIDAGVGGHTAVALGQVLKHLAETHQVIVVTHLPQVAVQGSVHYRVSKSNDATPVTTLESVSGDARIDEIARMLSGEVNETSRTHARELLEACS